MNIALTRSDAGYRIQFQGSRAKAPARDLGELASKILIVTLFSYMSTRIAQDCAETGHVTGMLMLASEALVVFLTLVRRSAGTVDRTFRARTLTMVATFGPPMVAPDSMYGIAPESVTLLIAGAGLIVVVLGKLSIGRSFGLSPANRGVVCTGMYRFVRHPIYLGYLIIHIGFLAANPSAWNVAILTIGDIALMRRAQCEEATLVRDEAYRAYMGRVRWRVLPGVF